MRLGEFHCRLVHTPESGEAGRYVSTIIFNTWALQRESHGCSRGTIRECTARARAFPPTHSGFRAQMRNSDAKVSVTSRSLQATTGSQTPTASSESARARREESKVHGIVDVTAATRWATTESGNGLDDQKVNTSCA